MKCPFCGFNDSKVVDSRPSEDSGTIRRRRECLSCGKRFTTFETIEVLPIVVIKKDGTRQAFDKHKMLNGLLRASEKRPISFEELTNITDSIEQKLLNEFKHEVSSTDIGELVMEELKKLDEVAYVRFASVYREFKDISTFMSELNKLLPENN